MRLCIECSARAMASQAVFLHNLLTSSHFKPIRVNMCPRTPLSLQSDEIMILKYDFLRKGIIQSLDPITRLNMPMTP